MYELLLTRKAQKFYKKAAFSLVSRLNNCFEQLTNDPYRHPNIKPLKGSLVGRFCYRVGDWRVVYSVNEKEKKVTILLIASRGQVY